MMPSGEAESMGGWRSMMGKMRLMAPLALPRSGKDSEACGVRTRQQAWRRLKLRYGIAAQGCNWCEMRRQRLDTPASGLT